MATVNGSNFFSDVNSTLSIALTDQSGLAVLAKCVGAAPTTADIFAHGCLIIRDTGTGTAAVYQNTGSSAVPSWTLMDVAGAIPGLPSAQMFVGNGVGVATAVAITGDVTIDNAGVTSIAAGAVVDADVSAIAAIAFSKMETLAAGNILVGNAVGVPTAVAMSGATTIDGTGVVTLGAGTVGSSNIATSVIQTLEFNLTAGDIVAMNGAPVEIVPAPGIASAIQFISAAVIYDFDTAAYTGGGDVTINYTGGSPVSTTISDANSFASAGDEITGCVALGTAGGIPLLVNTGLSITNATAPFSNPGTAAGVGRILVTYRIVATGL